jgi:hypothetical protein
LKLSDGPWTLFCRRLNKRKAAKLAALIEHTKTPDFDESELIKGNNLPGSYPQLLRFERDAAGNWKPPISIRSKDRRTWSQFHENFAGSNQKVATQPPKSALPTKARSFG